VRAGVELGFDEGPEAARPHPRARHQVGRLAEENVVAGARLLEARQQGVVVGVDGQAVAGGIEGLAGRQPLGDELAPGPPPLFTLRRLAGEGQ
jgi:hypothetical protein